MDTVANGQGLLSVLDEAALHDDALDVSLHHYLELKARKKGVPLRGTFELTPLCNLDCRMCYVHLKEAQLQATGKTILTGAQWKQLMKEAVDLGLMYALLTGGEAMLHPDFEELYLYLRSCGIRTSVNTNGLLLTDERIAFFKRYPPEVLRITLYGADDESYCKVTGHRVYARVSDAIRRAKEAGIRVAVSITPNRYMADNLTPLLDFCDALGAEWSVNSSLSDARPETGRNRNDYDLTLEEHIRIRRELLLRGGGSPTPCKAEDMPEAGGPETERLLGLRCSGGRSSFALTWDGLMHPCLRLPGTSADPLRSSLAEAWQEIFEAASRIPNPMECQGCAYQRVCEHCVASHLSGAPAGHCNPEICRRGKQLVLDGIVKI